MNLWLACALALLVVGVTPGVLVAGRGSTVDRLTGLAMVSSATTLVLLLLATGFGRSSYVDVGLVLAALSLTGSLVFARLVVRE